MIIFNTTYHLEQDVHDEAIEFLKKTYVPRAIASALLYSPRLSRIYVQYEENGASYALTFRVKDMETLDKWMDTEGVVLDSELKDRFGERVIGFSTLLQRIELD